MFTKEQLALWRKEGFNFPPGFYDEVAVEKIVETEKKKKEESVEKKYEFQYDDDPIIVQGIKYTFSLIMSRINIIKYKVSPFYTDLSSEEKLILDLPLIQWKMNFKHGAVMILHWLEGSEKSIELDYNFFMSEERVKKIDELSLKSYFNKMVYISLDDINHIPSDMAETNYFLYNITIPSVQKSYELFRQNLKKITKNTEVGNITKFPIHIGDNTIKDNYIQSFSIGSALGNMDDVGTALGRYSYRIYYTGFVFKEKNDWFLSVSEVVGRFVDAFSFNDSSSDWKSQSLGCWRNNLEDPDVSRLKHPFSNKICLENSDFRTLKKKANSKGVRLGGDFLIYSQKKSFSQEFIKKIFKLYNKNE